VSALVGLGRDVQITHLDFEALNETQKSAAHDSQTDSIYTA